MITRNKNMILLLMLICIVLVTGCREEFVKEEVSNMIEVVGRGQVEVEEISGQEVKLRAQADDKDWEFVEWRGDLMGDNEIQTVVVEEEMKILAKFAYVGPDIKGSGSKDDPFVIYTLEGLEKINDEEYPLDDYYELGRDIDATATQNNDYNDGKGWLPIGQIYSHGWDAFTGVFDGKGYKIENLYINRKGDIKSSGLFFVIEKGEVKNLNLIDLELEGGNNVGGIAGANMGLLKNIEVTGRIKGKENVGALTGVNNNKIIDSRAEVEMEGSESLGGIAGLNGGIIETSKVNAKIFGDENKVGGLIGYNRGLIKNCQVQGEIRSKGDYTGGLAGYNDFKIKGGSFAEAEVISRGDEVGGLVGLNIDEIEETYFKGKVKGNDNVGGLVGYNLGGVIKKSYAEANVLANGYAGGLIGINKATVENVYGLGEVEGRYMTGVLAGANWNAEINKAYFSGHLIGEKGPYGGFVADNSTGKVHNSYWNKEYFTKSDEGTGKTEQELKKKDTFKNWDFDNIWAIEQEESYPYFKWQDR